MKGTIRKEQRKKLQVKLKIMPRNRLFGRQKFKTEMQFGWIKEMDKTECSTWKKIPHALTGTQNGFFELVALIIELWRHMASHCELSDLSKSL